MSNFNFEDEIDFKDVVKNPKRWFGAYYLLLIIGLLFGGALYLKNMNNIFMNRVNNSIYLPDSVNIDESTQFMIDAASDEIIKAASAKANQIEKISNDLKTMQNSNWAKTICDSKKLASMLVNSSSWRNDKKVFVNMLLTNINNNGVSSNFAELSSGDVDIMFTTLLSMVNTTSSNS